MNGALDDHLRRLEPNDLHLDYIGVSHLDCVSRVISLARTETCLEDNTINNIQNSKLPTSQANLSLQVNKKTRGFPDHDRRGGGLGSFTFSISQKVSHVITDACCPRIAKSLVLNFKFVGGFRTKSVKVGVKLI